MMLNEVFVSALAVLTDKETEKRHLAAYKIGYACFIKLLLIAYSMLEYFSNL